jgi:hypothetical protein
VDPRRVAAGPIRPTPPLYFSRWTARPWRHSFDTVDLAVVEDMLSNRLGDLVEFARVIRGRLPREG